MDRVRQKAEALPRHGVPEHILKLLPCDDLLDKIQIQKVATPVPGRSNLDDVAVRLSQTKPNGVVLEKSSYDEADINAQRISAIVQFASRLNVAEPGALEDNEDNPENQIGSTTADASDIHPGTAQSKRAKLSMRDGSTIAEGTSRRRK